MAIVRWKPMRDLVSVQSEMNRLFDNIWGDTMNRDSSSLMPPVDLIENEDNFVITTELPGIMKDNIKMSVQNNTLNISGNKKSEFEDSKGTFHRIERSYGSFSRSVSLPSSVDPGKIKASFDTGILTITIPKSAEAKAKEIKIEVK